MNKKDIKDNIFQMKTEIKYPVNLLTKGYLIFYPTNGYHLSKNQYESFFYSINRMNLYNEVFCFDIEFIDNLEKIALEEIRRLTNMSYLDYKKSILLFENCIFDEILRWSICVYQDYWGILYGSQDLLNDIAVYYDFKSDLLKFDDELVSCIDNEKVKNTFKKLMLSSLISRKN